MAENNYAINYDDERFKSVNNEKQDRLNEVNNTYNNMISQSDQYYQKQIDAAKDYATTQQDLQNQQTQLAIDEINQQKEKANKDYLKEQRGAYSDWQKESNRYGVNAEQQAASGLRNAGYSESSQVSMYNTYQNRVSTARESYNLAIQNYDNGIREARLQNNSKLAEIAYQALQTELELSLNGFQYKNQLLLDQVNKQQEIDNTYYNRWQNVLSQMNTENAMAESIRQYNEKMAEEQRQYNESMAENVRQYNTTFDENVRQYNEKMAYQKERDKVADKQWEKEYKLAKKAASSSKKRSSSGGGTSVNLTNGSSKNGTLAAQNNTNSSSSSSGTSSWSLQQFVDYYKGSGYSDKEAKKLAEESYNKIHSKSSGASHTSAGRKDSTVHKATSTPKLSTKVADGIFNTVSKKSYTKKSDLEKDLDRYIISSSDKSKIIKAFGF